MSGTTTDLRGAVPHGSILRGSIGNLDYGTSPWLTECNVLRRNICYQPHWTQLTAGWPDLTDRLPSHFDEEQLRPGRSNTLAASRGSSPRVNITYPRGLMLLLVSLPVSRKSPK